MYDTMTQFLVGILINMMLGCLGGCQDVAMRLLKSKWFISAYNVGYHVLGSY